MQHSSGASRGIPSFMRLPVLDDPSHVDVALVGVPLDGGTDSVDSAFASGTGTLMF
jgi:arginase family enzyme